MLKLNRFFFDQAISIDNALTTNQIIHQIIKQVKEVVEYVNSLETDAHEYTDAKVLELKTQLEQQISDLETYLKGYTDTKLVEGKTYTDSEIANLRINYIDVKVSEIYATITSLESRLNAKIDLVDATLTNLIGDVRTELIELIKKGNSIIYSGYTGLLTALQDEIHNIYDVYSKFFGLTWNKFHLFFDSTTTCLETLKPDNQNSPQTIIKVDGNYYHYKYTSNAYNLNIEYNDDVMAKMIFRKTTGNFGSIDAVSINGFIYSGENVVKNADNNLIYCDGVSIESIDYSYGSVRLGTYDGETFTPTVFLLLSKINPTAEHRKVKITWNTLDYLTSQGVDISYDFVNYYFYSDFNNVFGELTLTDTVQRALNQTLLNFDTRSNYPNNCNIANQFGQNDLPFLNNTIDYFSEDVKARNSL